MGKLLSKNKFNWLISKFRCCLDEQGQTIASVILIMILALGVGVTISSRFLRHLRNSVREDNSSRALSIAEASIERMLNTDYQVLLDYIQFNNCGSACSLSITGSDGIVATSNVTLSLAGGSSAPFEIGLNTQETVEVALSGYPANTNLSVCWDNLPSGESPSVYADMIYGTDGNYLAKSYAYNSIGSTNSSNGFSTATAANGYANCFTVNSQATPNFLRLKSIYSDLTVYVLPSNGTTLPSQGIRVVSTGTVLDSSRTVTVLITSPHLPMPFDYVLFSKSSEQPLSN